MGRGDLAIFMEVALATVGAARADLALAAAQASVRKYLDQEITYVASEVAVLDGSGKPWLRLPERPVRGVTLVEEGDGTSDDWEATDTADYVLRRSIIYKVDGSIWTAGNVNVRVTYSHGWNIAVAGTVDSESDSDYTGFAVPADIVLATLNVARRIYTSSGTEIDGGTLEAETIGAYSYSRGSESAKAGGVELVDAEKMILDRYRFQGVA